MSIELYSKIGVAWTILCCVFFAGMVVIRSIDFVHALLGAMVGGFFGFLFAGTTISMVVGIMYIFS